MNIQNIFKNEYFACQQVNPWRWKCKGDFYDFQSADRYSNKNQTKNTGGRTTLLKCWGGWPNFIKQRILSQYLIPSVKIDRKIPF